MNPSGVDAMDSDVDRVGTPKPAGLGALARMTLRRGWVVVLAAGIGFAGALHVSHGHHKVYSASGQVRLETSKGIADDLLGTTGPVPSTHAVAELSVLAGPAVAKAVGQAMLLPEPPPASFTPQTDPNLVVVSVEGSDPTVAAVAVNDYGTAYVQLKRNQDAALVVAATNYLKGQVATVQGQITAIQNQLLAAPPLPALGLLTPAQATEKAANDLAASQLPTLVAEQQAFQNRLGQLALDAALGKQSDAALLTPALAATTPISPRPGRDAALGGAVGLLLGIGLALLFEAMDDRVRTAAEVEWISPFTPVLATLSGGALRRGRDGAPRRSIVPARPLVMLAAPRSSEAEAYRSLRTSIRFLGHDHPIRVLQVTRAAPGGEHARVLANLAISWAESGQPATMLGADLRRPELPALFGVANDAGVTSVIIGDATLEQVSVAVGGVAGLTLVPAGPTPPNPSELLSSIRTDQIVADLVAGSGLVLMDSPPVVPVTDAAVLSRLADATILVVVLRSTTRRELADALQTLRRADAPLAGLIVLDGRWRPLRQSRYSSPRRTMMPRRPPAGPAPAWTTATRVPAPTPLEEPAGVPGACRVTQSSGRRRSRPTGRSCRGRGSRPVGPARRRGSGPNPTRQGSGQGSGPVPEEGRSGAGRRRAAAEPGHGPRRARAERPGRPGHRRPVADRSGDRRSPHRSGGRQRTGSDPPYLVGAVTPGGAASRWPARR